MSRLPRFITDSDGIRRPYADSASGTLQPRFECCCGCEDGCCDTYTIEVEDCAGHNATHNLTRAADCAVEWGNRDDVGNGDEFIVITKPGGTWTATLAQKDAGGDIPIEVFTTSTSGDCPPAEAWTSSGFTCSSGTATITDDCA